MQRFRALDALNFLLADVRGAVGPFLNVFLITQQGWSQSAVGLVTTVSGLAGLAAQAPAGALIDGTRAKRGVVTAALVALGLATATLSAFPDFWPVLVANTALSVVGDLFGPAIAALTLGLFAARRLPAQMARNSAFDHAGNVFIALAAGLVGRLFGQRAVFLLGPLFAALAIAAVLSIPGSAIDHDRARGEEASASAAGPTRWRAIAGSRPLLSYSLCVALFHFANAPLLPMVGQKLAADNAQWATAMMSACIVAAQLVMLPVALLSGRSADRWGRKPVLLAGFVILPIRAVLYPLSDDPAWLIGIQLLDGLGAGIYGVLTPLLVADLMRGSGHYNFALGVVTAVQGAGAALSGLAAGMVIDRFGYDAAFYGLGGVAAIALLTLALFLPETVRREPSGSPGSAPRPRPSDG